VRPTPDRVRETVFNWLAPTLDGARCLDLFAGTGVLGLEALSRGAAETVFVERDHALVAALRAQIEKLGAAAHVVDRAALTYLRGPSQRTFDIVFLDPPYAVALEPLLTLLPGWLGEAATIYVERPRTAGTLGPIAASVPGLQVAKEAHAGDVLYGLLRYERA